eukprot:Awhi_evm1s639
MHSNYKEMTSLTREEKLLCLKLIFTSPSVYENLKFLFLLVHLFKEKRFVEDVKASIQTLTLDAKGLSVFKKYDLATQFPFLSTVKLSNALDIFQKTSSHLSYFTSLQNLDVSNCTVFPEVDFVGNLVNLSSLNLSGISRSIVSCISLRKLKHLQHLDLSNTQIEILDFIEDLVSLKSLKLENCTSFRHMGHLRSRLQNIPGTLQSLNVCNTNLTDDDFSGIIHLTNLDKLEISKSRNITTLSFIQSLPLRKMTSFNLQGCYNLRNITNLNQFAFILSLNINGCLALYDQSRPYIRLSFVNFLENLTSLSLDDHNFLNLPEFNGRASLEHLSIRNCVFLENIINISTLKNLKTIQMENCRSLRSIRPLHHLNGISTLNLEGCKNVLLENELQIFNDQSFLANVQHLNIVGATLKDFHVLRNRIKLKSVNMSRALYLKSTAGLAR